MCIRDREYTARFGSVPDMDVSVSPSGAMDMSALMSSNSKDVVLLGSDLDTLQTAAEQVEEAMTQDVYKRQVLYCA